MFGKKTILVVDDDRITRIVVRARLEARDGHKVFTASFGEDALILAKRKKPDVIILDWMMPGLSGIQVLNALKKSPETADIPVFMLTGKGKMGDVEKAFALGAEGYISKPFSVQALSTKIMSALYPA